jgi:hypothetical protein
VSLFSGLETIAIVSSPLFSLFLDPTSEIIVEASGGLDEVIYCLGEFLNSHSILNVGLQSFIELCHLSALVPGHSGRVLREAREIFGDGALLFRCHKLEFCCSYFVEVPIRFVEKGNILFNILQYFLDFWGTFGCRAYIQIMRHVGFESGVSVSP